jgi:hypothetical protein
VARENCCLARVIPTARFQEKPPLFVITPPSLPCDLPDPRRQVSAHALTPKSIYIFCSR